MVQRSKPMGYHGNLRRLVGRIIGQHYELMGDLSASTINLLAIHGRRLMGQYNERMGQHGPSWATRGRPVGDPWVLRIARSKAVRCRKVLRGGIRIVEGSHVFTGDLYISATVMTNGRLDDRVERLYSALSLMMIITIQQGLLLP